MVQFTGRLQGQDLDPSNVLIDIADGRFRVSAGRRQLGSWSLDRIATHRTSIYKFTLDIEGEEFDFYPNDPSTFSDAVGAVIDLSETKSRFGLRERIERAASS
ncbi:MAG TPA: hypothetical protein VF148_18915 [Acidimicrobiia bacterium]